MHSVDANGGPLAHHSQHLHRVDIEGSCTRKCVAIHASILQMALMRWLVSPLVSQWRERSNAHHRATLWRYQNRTGCFFNTRAMTERDPVLCRWWESLRSPQSTCSHVEACMTSCIFFVFDLSFRLWRVKTRLTIAMIRRADFNPPYGLWAITSPEFDTGPVKTRPQSGRRQLHSDRNPPPGDIPLEIFQIPIAVAAVIDVAPA